MPRFLIIALSMGALFLSPVMGQTLGAVEQRLAKIESTLEKVERRQGKVRDNASKPLEPSLPSVALLEEFTSRLAALERLVAEQVASGEQGQRTTSLGLDELARLKGDTEQRLEAIEEKLTVLAVFENAAQPIAAMAEAKLRTPDDRYLEALGFAEKKDWIKAEFAFDTFIATYPEHLRVGEARYWLGRSFQGQGKMAQAGQVFLNVFEKYPSAAFTLENLFALAQTLTDIGPENKEQSCAVYDQIETISKNQLNDSQRSILLDRRISLNCAT